MYNVIILCAGMGERLLPLTEKTNKSLLTIGEKTIIEHFLNTLEDHRVEISTVHIIIGHYGYKFRELLSLPYKWLKIRFHENPLYSVTGAAQSLFLVADVLARSPCIILEGDHYVDKRLIDKLFESNYPNCLLVDDFMANRTSYDEEVIAYGLGNKLDYLQWPGPYLSNNMGEALTIFKFSRQNCETLSYILRAYLQEDGPTKREIIEPINRLNKMLSNIFMIPTDGLKWIEIDTEKDLETARAMKFEP